MFLETTASDDRISIRPAGFLGLSAIPDLMDHFLRALDRSESFELDMSDISGIDTAGIQFLMLLRKEGSHLGKRISFARPSPEVRDVMESVGQADFLVESVGSHRGGSR